MLTRTDNREATGFLLSAAFVVLAAARDVYLAGLLQQVHPLVVAMTGFSLGTLSFLAVALVRDRAGLTVLRRHWRRLGWVNVTSALAWISFFFALRTIEPALVQILFFGIGPLSVRSIDGHVTGTPAAPPGPHERRLQLGLALSLGIAAVVVLSGLSGLGPQPLGRAAPGIALALGGGTSIAISTLLCRTLNDAGVGPTTLLALRFPGTVVLALALAALSPGEVFESVSPRVLAGVGLASFLLIVLPNYVNQIGVSLASPVTVRAVLAVGPVLVFALQLVEGRLSPSPATLAACGLYAGLALAVATARRHAIAAGARVSGRPVTAGRAARPASSTYPC
jgi:drug/metabolite transporter (DMT)-like permease